MSRELPAKANPFTKEQHTLPQPVNFKQVAQNAVAEGLFASNPIAKTGRDPISLLDNPYGNGPMVIERFGVDVPQKLVNAVRKNFVTATRLLLPTEQVMSYFHQRFFSGDIFQSESISTLVNQYRAPRISLAKDESNDGNTFSFQTEGVDRKTYNRKLFTREESIAGVQLVQEHPETGLTILMYQSVLQDYFENLRSSFMEMAGERTSKVTEKNLQDYDNYARQWTNNNFTAELIPALGIFYKQKRNIDENSPTEQLLDQSLFQNAVDFIVTNGAFRNWVTVPDHVAQDGKERVNHFLCPAVGVVREHLLDGFLLKKIHSLVTKKSNAGDERILMYTKKIQDNAQKNLQNKDKKPMTAEELERKFEEQKKITFTYEGNEYTIKADQYILEAMYGQQEIADKIISPLPGDRLYRIIKQAAITSLAENTPVFFNFNDQGYRLTSEKIKEILTATGLLRASSNT